jgi:hypothetical protein
MNPPAWRLEPVRPIGVVHGEVEQVLVSAQTPMSDALGSGTATSWGGTKEEQSASRTFNKEICQPCGYRDSRVRPRVCRLSVKSGKFAQKPFTSYIFCRALFFSCCLLCRPSQDFGTCYASRGMTQTGSLRAHCSRDISVKRWTGQLGNL